MIVNDRQNVGKLRHDFTRFLSVASVFIVAAQCDHCQINV